MINQPPRIHLFQGFGVELEYMIVDRDTLKINPIADELIKYELGHYDSDFENGMVTWSNELVLHVIELKSTKPEIDLAKLQLAFSENIETINTILKNWNAMLLPTGAHPFMNPLVETKIWPHGNNEVYELYNQIFDCRGHGWSNLQSVHLNLPFYDDEEFAKLHASVRLVLPILPGLCASTPVLDGKLSGVMDTRLKYYKSNQSKIPSITGRVIPEAVFSKRNYLNVIYDKIKQDITPYDKEGILNPIWVNSRGAISRFDRGSIEIRVMDCQESAAADIAMVTIVIELVKALVSGRYLDFDGQMKWKTEKLAALYDKVVEKAGATVVEDTEYLRLFNVQENSVTVQELWTHLVGELSVMPGSALPGRMKAIDALLKNGTLSQRIVKRLGSDFSQERLLEIYKQLGQCLASNTLLE